MIKKALILAAILLSITGLALVMRSSFGSSECISAQLENPPAIAISPAAMTGWAGFVQQLSDYAVQQTTEVEGGAAELDVSGLTFRDWIVIVDPVPPAVGGIAEVPEVDC